MDWVTQMFESGYVLKCELALIGHLLIFRWDVKPDPSNGIRARVMFEHQKASCLRDIIVWNNAVRASESVMFGGTLLDWTMSFLSPWISSLKGGNENAIKT